MMGFIKIQRHPHLLFSNGYNPQPQQIILLMKKPDKSIFDSKIDAITHRIQEDFVDEEISNFPGRKLDAHGHEIGTNSMEEL
jgi:hypothetical protein